MIRGMGLYGPDGVHDVDDVRSWQQPGDGHPEPKLRELLQTCSTNPADFIWLGLFEPTKDELEMVARVFSLPRLQVEDSANAQQRAKFELDENGYGLAVLKTLDYVDATSDVHTGQLAVFVGPQYVITVRFGQIADLRPIRQRVTEDERLRRHGPRAVFYAILDAAVDTYVRVVDAVGDDVSDLETEVFAAEPEAATTNAIYRLKRENVEIRRAVSPLVVWAHQATDQRVAWVSEELAVYFADVGDHVLRTMDTVEATDNLLMAMLMASTSLQDLQQNRDMRKISAWVAIAAVPTAIAAIYGMNFDDMPELHWKYGYAAVLAIMAGGCLFLHRLFKRSGWL
jgi:magnesium transporter